MSWLYDDEVSRLTVCWGGWPTAWNLVYEVFMWSFIKPLNLFFFFFGILVTTSGFVAEQDGNSSCPYKHTKTRAQLLGRANTINVLRARGLAGLSLSFHPDFPPHSPTYLPLPRTKSEKNCLKAFFFSEKIMYVKRWVDFKSCCSQ